MRLMITSNARLRPLTAISPLVRITRHEDATDDGPLVMLVQGLAKGEKMDSVIRHATEPRRGGIHAPDLRALHRET